MPTPTPRSPDARRRPAPVTSTAPLTAALASEGATPASESRAESASAVDASSVDAALAGCLKQQDMAAPQHTPAA